MQQKVRLGYLVPASRSFSGIERVVHEVATSLAEQYSNVLDITVLYGTDYDEPVLKSTRYTKRVLNVKKLRELPSRLRHEFAEQQFDVFICPQVEASTLAWLSLIGRQKPLFITHLHGNPSIEERRSLRSRLLFKCFRWLVLPRIAAILAVSPSLRDFAASLFGSVPLYFAPNPVRQFEVKQRLLSANTHAFRYLCVARVSRLKGHDLLLQAFAKVQKKLPEATLTLVGKGAEVEEMKELSRTLGVDRQVIFAGHLSDPQECYQNADGFVFASRGEGFGMVLVEALSAGLPLVSMDCKFGPADVITSPRIGILTAYEDVDALAEGMYTMAQQSSSEEDRKYRHEVAATYHPTQVGREHFRLLSEIIQQKASAILRSKFAALTEPK